MSIDAAGAQAFECCVAAGGVVVFPADTVYGLACDPCSATAVARLYGLKGRAADKPAAVMFFSLERALEALPELGPGVRAALAGLLPGALTVLVENPHGRFPLASPPVRAPVGTRPRAPMLGLRVPASTGLESVAVAVLQSSANLAGGADARTLAAVPASIRDGADLVLDGGTLPGTPSTVIDLWRYERQRRWDVRREGAVSAQAVADILEHAGPDAR